MSKLAELLKKGYKLVDNTGDNIVIKAPTGETKHIPRKFLGDNAYGSTSTPDMDKPIKEGMDKLLNPRSNGDLQQMMNKQPIDLRPSVNPLEDRLKAMAKGSAMNMVGGNTDMLSGSLGALKDLGNKYEEDVRKPIKEGMANLIGAKDNSDEAIGKRILSPFDITKDKSGFPEIEGAVGDYATDPMSLTDLIPGKVQAGAMVKGAKETLPMLKKLLMR